MHSYLVTNKINGNRYIGVTSQKPRIRWKAHVSQARRKSHPSRLHNAINKYGEEAFAFEILKEYVSFEEMIADEIKLIVEYGTLNPNGYNLTVGGQGTVGYKWNDEGRKNMSERNKGKSTAHATTASVLVTKGKPFTEDHKQKISKALTGIKRGKMSIEHRLKIGRAFRGKTRNPMSSEAKDKLSTAHKKIQSNPEVRIAHSKRMEVRSAEKTKKRLTKLADEFIRLHHGDNHAIENFRLVEAAFIWYYERIDGKRHAKHREEKRKRWSNELLCTS